MSKAKKKEPKKGIVFNRTFQLILYGFILLVAFFRVYNNVYDDKINLGGDNANYYILGQSIARGEGFKDIHFLDKRPHTHFPPGYPVIVGAVSKIFSNDIQVIKKANGFFFAASIFLIFIIVLKLTDNAHIAFFTSLLTLLNFHLLQYSFIMMSEVPFLAFTLLCLWLAMKTDYTKAFYKNWMFYLLIVAIAFTYHIRSTGLALVAGIALFLAFRKYWAYLATFVGGFVVLCLPWYFRNKAVESGSYLDQLIMKNPYRPAEGQLGIGGLFERIWTNFERYIGREIPSGTFNLYESVKYQEPVSTNEWLTGIVLTAVMIFGLIMVRKYQTIFIFYIAATFGILLIWPEVWFGVRFLLPLVPLLIFLFIWGVFTLFNVIGTKLFDSSRPVLAYIAAGVVVLFYFQSYGKRSIEQLEANAQGVYANSYANFFQLGQWVRNNASDTSVTCNRKGAMFYLFSTKYVTGYKNTTDTEEQIQHLIDRSTDYVVLEQLGYSSTGRYLYPATQRYPEKFKVIQHLKNPDTYLMEFHPELGYWGDWKDDKREGQGTYGWADGRRFKGQWVNNKRNGEGTLYFANGTYLEGTWTNDALNGEAVLYSKEGEVIERSRYQNNSKVEVREE